MVFLLLELDTVHFTQKPQSRVTTKVHCLCSVVMNVGMGDRMDMSYSKALPSTPPNTPHEHEKPTRISADSVVELMSHPEEKLEKTYAKNEAAASKLYGHVSDFVNDATVHEDLKHRKRASAGDLLKKDKRDFVVARSESERYPLGRARKLLLGNSWKHSFESEGSEHTGQTDPVDDSLKSDVEGNYIVDSQQRAPLEAQANAPSAKAPRTMSSPVLYTAPHCLRHLRSKSDPSVNRPLSGCLKHNDSSSRNSFSSQNSVHFGTVNIREYDRRLSDNPAVTGGPPIGLDWGYNPKEMEVMVDDYENLHPTRRVKEEFLMPARVREEMLVCEWGHTMRAIRQASAESEEIRLHREKTMRSSKISEKLTEALESSKRKFRRLKTRTTDEMEQEKLWHDASKWLDTNRDEISSYS
jgi:hypothetical protein